MDRYHGLTCLFMFYLLSYCGKLLSVWICTLLLSLSYSSHHLVGACLVRAQQILAVQQPLVEVFLVVWGANRAKMRLIRTHSVPPPPQEGSDSLLRQVDSSPIYTRCLCIPAPLRSGGLVDRILFKSECMFAFDADAPSQLQPTGALRSKYVGLLFLLGAGCKTHKFSAEQVGFGNKIKYPVYFQIKEKKNPF